jgi:hypothetical protein
MPTARWCVKNSVFQDIAPRVSDCHGWKGSVKDVGKGTMIGSAPFARLARLVSMAIHIIEAVQVKLSKLVSFEH